MPPAFTVRMNARGASSSSRGAWNRATIASRAVFGRDGLVLHGGTAVAKRKQMVADFQREDGPPFFVLTVKAGGTGLNLTEASHVVHFDRWWNPAVENQATDRAHRIGQTKPVFVYKLIAEGTVEERIVELQNKKGRLATATLDARAAVGSLAAEDLDYLFGE